MADLKSTVDAIIDRDIRKTPAGQPGGLDLGVTEALPAGNVEQPLAYKREPEDDATSLLAKARGAARGATMGAVEQELGRSAMRQTVDRIVQRDEGEKDTRIYSLYGASLSRSPDQHAAVKEISRKTGVAASIIEKRLPEFQRKFEASGFDARKYRAVNPAMAELMLENPSVAPLAFHDKTIPLLTNVLTRARNTLLNRGEIQLNPEDADYTDPETGEPVLITPTGRKVYRGGVETEVEGEIVGGVQQPPGKALRGGEWVEQSLLRESPLAKELTREEEMFIAPMGRIPQMIKETFVTGQKQIEHSMLAADLADARSFAEKSGKSVDTWAIERQMLDLKTQMGQAYYNADPVTQMALDAAEILPSQLQSYKGAGIGAGAGAVVAGGAVLATTRSPMLARRAALKGAAVGSRPGVFLATQRMEYGSAYADFLGTETDLGEQISEPVARQCASAYSFVAAGIETAFFPAAMRMFGPAGDAIASGTGKAFFKGLLRNAGTRKILADAGKRILAGALAEGKEEFLQSLASDLSLYAGKTATAGRFQQADLVGSLETGFEAGTKAFRGTLVLGGAGGATNIGTQSMMESYQRDRAHEAGRQVAALAKVAETSDTARAAPDVVAELVRRESEKSGEAITHMYVDAGAFSRLFQGEGPKAEEAAAELLGEDGPQRLKEALAGAHDGKIEVPVADYLDRWGGKKIATVLAQDTTVRPGLPTTREQIAQDKEIPDRRKKLVAEYQKDNAPAPESEAEQRLVEAVGTQLAKTGVYKPAEARQAVALTRALLRTQAEVSGTDPDTLFADYALTVEQENAQPAPESALSQSAVQALAEKDTAPADADAILKEQWAEMEPEERIRAMFIEREFGVLNERAFNAMLVDPAKPNVAHISVEGVKYANRAGHEIGNALYAAAANTLHAIAPDIAKVGGDFALHAKDQAELDQVLAQANEAMPAKGFAFTGALGPTFKEAGEAHGAVKGTLEAAGKRAARGARPKGLRTRTFGEFVRDVFKGPAPDVVGSHLAAVQDAAISESLRQAFTEMPDEAAYEAVNRDAKTGFLSRQGFKALPKKAHVTSLDLNKLGAINKLYGTEVGDKHLERFAEAVKSLDPTRFDFAHFSGDEYAAQSDDPVALQLFIDAAGELCDSILQEMPDGSTLEGITFGYGIGATYETADAKLEGHKQKGVKRERRARTRRTEARRTADRRGADPLQGVVSGRGGPAVQEGLRQGRGEGQGEVRPVGPRLAQSAQTPKTRLYRAAEFDSDVFDMASFSEDIEAAEKYQDNPGYGGPNLFSTEVDIDFNRVLDLTESRDALKALVKKLGMSHPGATTVGEWIHFDSDIGDQLREKGYLWLRIPESYPEGSITWVWLGDPETGDLPTLEPIEAQEELYQADKTRGERGYVDRMRSGMKRIFKIVLTDKADLSTFLHESSHVFLDLMGDLATRESANERLTADWERTLKWLGVKDYSEIGVEQHEKWASAFETYLREGKAPSAELVGAFQRFKLWLTQIYKALAPGELDDEIRSVFDRMLATDQEIARMQRAMGADKEVFRSPEDAGMSPSEWQSYLEDKEKAFARATAQTQRQVLKEQIKATETHLKAERRQALEDAGREYDARPEVLAYEFLKNGQAGENEALKALLGEAGSPPGLNRETVQMALGNDVVKTQFRGLTEQGGIDPEELSDIVGSPDGATLLKSIAERPEKVQWATTRAEELLGERVGDVEAERQKLEDAASEALHKEGNSDWLLKEWQALRRRRGEGGAPAPLESIRLAARDIVDSTPVRALRPGRVLQAERSASNRAAVAAAKKDWRTALLEKQKQLLNHYIHRETTQAIENRDKFEKLADKLTDRKRREALGKAGKAFLDAADSILEALGFADPETDPAALGDRKTTPEWMAALEDQGILPAFAGDLLSAIVANPPASWRDLSVADVEMLRTALSQLYRAARDVNQVMLLGKQVQIQEVQNQIADQSAHLPSQPAAPASESQRTARYKAKQIIQGIDAVLTDPEQLVRTLGETARRFFWDRYTDQRAVEDRLAEKVLKFFLEGWNDLPLELQRRKHEPLAAAEIAKLPFPADVRREVIDKKGNVKVDRAWMWMLALNTGNQSNLDRLLGGYEWDEQTVRDFLAKNMTREEWAFVQKVWDLMDAELYPDVAKQYEATNGVKPKKIEALPFNLPDGTVIRGGYFPARYDPVASRLGEQQRTEALSKLYDPGPGGMSISKGFTKERTKSYTDVISLQWNEVPRHVAQVIHYIAFDSYMRDAGRVMAGLQNTIGERLGDQYYPQLKQWLKVVASPVADMSPEHLGPVVKALGGLRSRFVISTLGYSLTVTGGDLTNSLVAIASGKIKSRFAIPAHIRTFTNWSEIRAMAPELQHRAGQWRTNMRRHLMQIGPAGQTSTLLDGVRESAWWLMEQTDRLMSTFVWKGAYDQARAAKRYGGKEMSHEDAVRDAGSIVRSMLPTHDPAEQPAILRDKRGVGSIIAFYGYFSKLYNLQRETIAPALLAWRTAEGAGEKVKTLPTAAQAAGRVMATIIVTELLAELFSGRGPEEEEEWGEWAVRKTLAAPGMYLPLIGQITEQAVNFGVSETIGSGARYRRPSVRASPAVATFDRMARAFATIASTEKEPDARIFALLEFAGVLFNLPIGSSQIRRTGTYIASGGLAEDVAAGKPGEAVEGLIYGRRDNQSKTAKDLVTDIAEGDFQ